MKKLERCAWCGIPHYPNVNPSVQVNGLSFCRMSHRNAYMEEKQNAYADDRRALRSHATREHG